MNIVLATDSYKLTHWDQYPEGTDYVYSYFESRKGAEFPYTVFFGLLPIFEQLAGRVVTQSAIDNAAALAEVHFGNDHTFNRAGWEHILREHDGYLPVRIRAVAEGSVVPVGNVLMTVVNTDPAVPWLTNALESLLTHVWYPSTVATLSRSVKELLAGYLTRTGCSLDGLPFMLHDFGYRGATTHDAAAIGGAGHLVNFQGTDTLPAMELAMLTYGADLDTLAFSVPATEHSVMTAEGPEGEFGIVRRLIEKNPTGILSVVADSYDIYAFVDAVGGEFKGSILARDGVFVVRPDSVTTEHLLPSTLVVNLMERLWRDFGGTTNDKGFRTLDPHVRLLWGDGIDRHGIELILGRACASGFAAENFVFGMGGGLLQRVNRDTQRSAFKCSAQHRNGKWIDVQKTPLDASKASKPGLLKLVFEGGEYRTVREEEPGYDFLHTVFENGCIVDADQSQFDKVRDRAAL